MQPYVSIIMPVRNGDIFLENSIVSVLEQDYTNWEFIIIDDASNDNTPLIIEKYASCDKRFEIITNKNHLGIAKSLNLGIEKCKGELIARIDSDDFWVKNKLTKQIDYLHENPDIMLLGTSKIVIDENGIIIPTKEKKIYSFYEIKRVILKKNLFCHSSVVFRKKIINAAGVYNERFKNTEDYEYWIRIVSIFKTEILPESLVYYRLHNSMISLKRRKQQNYYVIRAKINGIFKYNYPLCSFIFIFKDIWFILLPDFLIKWKKSFIKKGRN